MAALIPLARRIRRALVYPICYSLLWSAFFGVSAASNASAADATAAKPGKPQSGKPGPKTRASKPRNGKPRATNRGVATVKPASSSTKAPNGQTPTAADETPSQEDDQRARLLFRQGASAYSDGNYRLAIELFKEVLKLSKRAELHFNLANAYERNGQLPEAAVSLEAYLPHADHSETQMLTNRLANMHKRLAQQKKQNGSTSSAGQPQPSAQDNLLRNAGYVTLASGGGLALVGVVLGAITLSVRGDAKAGCIEGICDATVQDDLEREAALALSTDILIGAGAVAAAGGLAMIVVGVATAEPAPKVGIAPRVEFGSRSRPGFVGLNVFGTF